MSEIKVHVEGAPSAVAEFFREMGRGGQYFGEVIPEDSEIPEIISCETVLQEAVSDDLAENLKQAAGEVTEKPRRGRPRKEAPAPVADPDPEFAELPDQTPVKQTGDSGELESPEQPAPEPEKPKLTLPQVQAALKEYGIWATEQGHDAPSVKPYLIALLRKYGNGANGTAELKEEYWQAVFDAAVSRVPLMELEEFR